MKNNFHTSKYVFLFCEGLPSNCDVGVARSTVFGEMRPGAGFENSGFGKEKLGDYRKGIGRKNRLIAFLSPHESRGQSEVFINSIRGTSWPEQRNLMDDSPNARARRAAADDVPWDCSWKLQIGKAMTASMPEQGEPLQTKSPGILLGKF